MEHIRHSVMVPNNYNILLSNYDDLVSIEPEMKGGSIIITRWRGKYFPSLFDNIFSFSEEPDKINKYLRNNVRRILSGQDPNIRIAEITIGSHRGRSTPDHVESSPFAVIIWIDLSDGIFADSCLHRICSPLLTIDDQIDFDFYICDDLQLGTMCCGAETIHPDIYYRIRSRIMHQIVASQFIRRITADEDEYWAKRKEYIFDSRYSSEYLVEEYTGLSNPAPHITDCRLETLERIKDCSGDYIPIEELGLSKGTYRTLQSDGFVTICDVLHCYETGPSYVVRNKYHHPFERIQGFGVACARDLEAKMRAYGYEDFLLTSAPKGFSEE